MKAKECKLLITLRNGYAMPPFEFPSIAEAVRYAKGGNVGFSYAVLVNGHIVRQGFCG